MRKNVIILTTGLSGSSVLTGLIARGGYWTGENTFKKPDYDTFENKALIELNLRLFQEAGYTGNYLLEFSSEAMQRVTGLYNRIDSGPYRALIEQCNAHQPWIWKDPRLWLTIRFWKHMLDLESCRFILLTRGPVQSWISSTLRRQIMTYRYMRTYEQQITHSIDEFFRENGLSHLHLRYEDLISNPAAAIEKLNQHLATDLKVEDLEKTYHKALYKQPRNSWSKHIEAVLIYLKNYSERLDIATPR